MNVPSWKLGPKQKEVLNWLREQTDKEEWFTPKQIADGTHLATVSVRGILKKLVERQNKVLKTKDERGDVYRAWVYVPATEGTAKFIPITRDYWTTTYAQMNPFMGNVSKCRQCDEYAVEERSWGINPATDVIEFRCKKKHTWRINKTYD
jgi:hypothetical protein